MYRNDIHNYMKVHENELINDVKKLIQINSERMEPKLGMPFGQGPAEALKEAEKIIASYGLSVDNIDNYVITADLNGKQRKLDILAHLDVVPAGDGWTVTDPFEPIVKEGKLYGRGAIDDKGPAIAALYALRAINELQIPMEYGVRLILGSDEECGGKDIAYYYSKNAQAPMTISPDADFPVVNIEKSRLLGAFAADYPVESVLPRIISVNAGLKVNVIPAKANATIEGLNAEEIVTFAEKVEKATGIHFTLVQQNSSICINAEGEGAHAMEPYKGNNALTGLLTLLSALPLADTQASNLVRTINKILPHGDYYGKALGIDLEDEKSGKTTVSFDLFHMNETELSGCFDVRGCLAANEHNTRLTVKEVLCKNDLTPGALKMQPPHYVPEDSELVQALMTSYKEMTGRCEKTIALGGSTYVHNISNAVAFGCAFKDVDNHMHGPDEFMFVEHLLLSAEIYADAIIRLCGEKQQDQFR
jgi:succinyl-diaminopimelate desuccinylase